MPWTYCTSCKDTAAWGRSPLCMKCLSRAGLLLTAAGAEVDAAHPPARTTLYAGRYRSRAIRCGKADCRACPHGYYVYRVWRVEGRQLERYQGPTDEPLNTEYTRPVLRAARASFGSQALATARVRAGRARRRGA